MIDDEQDFREMLNIAIVKEGFKTEMAYNRDNFLEKIDDFQPDIVTLDVMTVDAKVKKMRKNEHLT